MSISPLPNGRFRVQVPIPGAKPVGLSKVLSPRELEALAEKFKDPRATGGTFASRKQATVAEQVGIDARDRRRAEPTTVNEWRDRWLTDKIFLAGGRSSTLRKYRNDTRRFAEEYGTRAMTEIDYRIVSKWLEGGDNVPTVHALRAMWTHATRPEAGRLVDENPWRGLSVGSKRHNSRGNRGVFPPNVQETARLIEIAYSTAPPSYARMLELGTITGMRSGELDGLRFEDVDFDAGEIRVEIKFDTEGHRGEPKTGTYKAVLSDRAAEIVRESWEETINGTYVFETPHNEHWTTAARRPYWDVVRAVFLVDPLGARFCKGKAQAAKTGKDPLTYYLATRHHFGWFLFNELEQPADKVAECLGHKDGGRLVYELYGHRDETRRRAQVRDAMKLNAARRNGTHLAAVAA